MRVVRASVPNFTSTTLNMPDAVRRRSSISAVRRGNQKYIPYGGDDFQRGKRTGIPVVIIDHSSDDFEPFEKLMDQADQRTPPRPKVQNKKKRPPKTPIIEETDDYGEIDMELEYSEFRQCSFVLHGNSTTFCLTGTPNSPAAYFTSRVSPIASSVKRVGSSSRPVNHSSDVDFNEIPSPRPRSSRKSLSHAVNGRGPGPSRLSRSFIANNSEENEDPDDLPFDDAGYDHIPPMDEEDDGHLLPPSSPPVSPTRSKSFGRIHEEGDEENGSHRGKNSMRGYEKTPSTGRGKGKQRQMEEDVEIEDDIAMGMEDVNMEEGEEEQVTPKAKKTRFRGEDESTEREQPASKKTKTEREAKKKPGRNARKENVLREGGFYRFLLVK